MSWQTINQAALDSATAVMGITFALDGVTYSGVRNTLSAGQSLEAGGFESEITESIVVSKTAMASNPIHGKKTGSFDGHTLRLLKVDQDQISYTLYFGSAKK